MVSRQAGRVALAHARISCFIYPLRMDLSCGAVDLTSRDPPCPEDAIKPKAQTHPPNPDFFFPLPVNPVHPLPEVNLSAGLGDLATCLSIPQPLFEGDRRHAYYLLSCWQVSSFFL